MKEYDILTDTGTARNLVKVLNEKAREGWRPISIGVFGQWSGLVYVLIEREIKGDKH